MTKTVGRASQPFFLLVALVLALGCSGDRADKRDKGDGSPKGSNKTPQEQPSDLSKVKPGYSVRAKQFAKEVEEKPDAARAKYAGKVIEVGGVVESILGPNESLPVPLLNFEVKEDMAKGLLPKTLSCSMAESAPWKKVLPGQTAKVRARFTSEGYLTEGMIVEVTGDPPPTLTADQLAKDYAEDIKKSKATEIFKKSRYEEKWLILTGEVAKTTVSNEANVTRGETTLILKTAGMMPKVSCTFSSPDRKVASGIQVGQKVKVLGKCSTGNLASGEVGLSLCRPLD